MSNISQIEQTVKKVVKVCDENNFIYDFLLAYDTPKSAVARLRKSFDSQPQTLFPADVVWKKKLLFRVDKENDLASVFAEVKSSSAHKSIRPRFIIVTDFQRLLAEDTKTGDSLDTPFDELPIHYAFFLPWAGMEKSAVQIENPADVKAAEKMAKLFDEIKRDNPCFAEREHVHNLNVFLTRLLFCFFAEDTDIFENGAFTQAVSSYTQTDGSDLSAFLSRLFVVLNTPVKLREEDLPDYLAKFPYVNGGLFAQQLPLPQFSIRSRNAVIRSGELNWAAINPDIFGSMIQNVVTDDDRGDFGIHYTSVPNIMKVIEPLFLNELNEEFEKACNPDASIKNPEKYKEDRLNALLNRIANVRIFDPACGSGNFLIIAYRELRKLEIKILKELGLLTFSSIQLRNFFGIEISDFSCEVAMLSLWLAEHQMNMLFKQEFGQCNPTLPLQEAGHMVCANATRIPWEDVCPHSEQETYILGNPPYLGSRKQTDLQKADLEAVFGTEYKSLDYICAWFYLAANYIRGFDNAKVAFVSTNSISQGELVSLIWPRILRNGIEIGFAHKDFKWSNNAKYNAAVIVVIIGLQNQSCRKKEIYKNGQINFVENISPYLTAGTNTYVYKRTKPFRHYPVMKFGNMPADNGYFLFNESEKQSFLATEPNAEKYLFKFVGSYELIHDVERYCLWLPDISKKELSTMPNVLERVEAVRKVREKSSRPFLAETPEKFAQITQRPGKAFIGIPKTSSERREYIPMGFLDEKTVSSTEIFTISDDAELFLFGLLTSKMHMVWVKAVCGRLKTDFRYSKDIVYNTFPFPHLSTEQKNTLTEYAQKVIFCREMYSEKTLAELYDPDKMPQDLKEAHQKLDLAVERCYRSKPFESDEERLEYLFKLYERMIAEENERR